MSIYGMGRFPVTLYKEQWLKLLDIRAKMIAEWSKDPNWVRGNSDVSMSADDFEVRRARLIAEWSKDPNWVRRNPGVK